MTQPEILFVWMSGVDHADQLTEFFVAEVDPSYISHSEMQWGRALDSKSWSPSLKHNILSEFTRVLGEAATKGQDHTQLAAAWSEESLCGLACVQFVHSAPQPFAVLEDLVVASVLRHRRIGHKFMQWIENEIRADGIDRVFLESGLHNNQAHNFFEVSGFAPVSKVFLKSLTGEASHAIKRERSTDVVDSADKIL